MEQEAQVAPSPSPLLDPSTSYRLDFEGVSKRYPARASYGFVISTAADGQLVAIGNGVLPAGQTCNQAECSGLVEGLKVAQSLGLKRVKAYGTSELVVNQVQHRSRSMYRVLRPLLPEVRKLAEDFDAFQVAQMDRSSDSLAEGLATMALNVDALLLDAGTSPPSNYSKVARRLGAALLLRREAVAHLDGADDFPRAVVQAVASRLQVDGAAVAARMGGLIAWKELKEPCYAPGLRITRTFSPTEAPVMTVALAALQKSEKLASTAAAAQLLIGTPGDMALLLPELQLQRVAGAEGDEVVLPAAQQGDAVGTDDADDDHQGFVASALQGIEGVEALEGLVLGEEMLGDAMQFQDGRVTHLLMFDGASKGNPGRAAFGYAIFDLYSKKLDAKGCRTLPYGRTAHDAEYHGLIAGLEAAAARGIKRIMVHGDAALVVEQVMYRRCNSGSSTARLFQRVMVSSSLFEHFEIQLVPRDMNRVADRLAQMSIEVDGVLYALLRKDVRGEAAMTMLLKAARLFKRNDRISRLLRLQEFPVLLVALLQGIMSLPPRELLQRLEDKALAMGDPNPWLVQEVRRVVNGGAIAFIAGSAASEALLQDGRTKAARTSYRLAVGDESYWRNSGRPKGSLGARGVAAAQAGGGSSSGGGGAAGAVGGGGSGGDRSGSSSGDSADGSSSSSGSGGSGSSSDSGGSSSSGGSSRNQAGAGTSSLSAEGPSRSGSRHTAPLSNAPGTAAHMSSSTHSTSSSWHSRMGWLQQDKQSPLLAGRQQLMPAAHCTWPVLVTAMPRLQSGMCHASDWPTQQQQQHQQEQQRHQKEHKTAGSHHTSATIASSSTRQQRATCAWWPGSHAGTSTLSPGTPMHYMLAAAHAAALRAQPASRRACLRRLVAVVMQSR